MVPAFMEKWVTDYRLGALVAILYGIIVLGYSLPNYQVGPYFDVVTDFYWDYVPSAQEAQKGNIQIDHYRGPMYPIALAIAGFIIPDLFTAGIILAGLSACFTLFFLFHIIKHLFRPDFALCAVLLTAVNPVFVEYSFNPGTDMFFVALVTGVLYFLLQSDQVDYRSLGIAAFLGALAYLTRYNGLFLVAAVPFIITVLNIYHASWKERLMGSAFFVAIFFLFITPWGLYCLSEKGDFFYNKNYENIAYEVYAKGEMGWDEYWYGESVDVNSLGEVIFKDPTRFFTNVFTNIPGHFMDDMDKLTGYYTGSLTMLGLALLVLLMITRRFIPPAKHLAFYAYGALFFAVLLLVFHGPRFSIFMLPVYVVLGLQIFTVGKNPAEQWFGNFRWIPALVAILLVLNFGPTYEMITKKMNTGTEHLLDVRDQFFRAVPENQRTGTVSARQPHIGYVLGLNFRRIPHEQNFDRLMAELREREIQYLYYGIIEFQMWPELRFLTDPNNAPEGLTPVVALPQTQNRPPVVLYRIDY